jgi:hypothetical protein
MMHDKGYFPCVQTVKKNTRQSGILPCAREKTFRRTLERTAKFGFSVVFGMLHQGSLTFHGPNLIRKTWAPLKVRIFLWLAFKRRTADRRHRHGLAADAVRSLCDVEPESNDHLFIHCSFTKQVWSITMQAIGGQWPDLHELQLRKNGGSWREGSGQVRSEKGWTLVGNMP